MKYIFFHEPAAYCRWRKCLLIMKLTAILLIAFVLTAGAKGTAQTVTLSMANAPLEKVCKEIEKQTGYYFVYAQNIGKNNYLVSVAVSHVTVEETLHRVFDGLPYKWQVINKIIVINTAVPVVAGQVVNHLPVDEIIEKVTGRILGEQGQPLTGATVASKSTGKLTLTDNKGEFTLTGVSVNSVLEITYIGYSPKTVVVKESAPIVVYLAVATNSLDETVVKGYYTTNNRLNIGDASTVKGEDIAKQPVTDPLQALEARVPGLYIQQTSGIPGAFSTIRLRGQNGFYNATSKLSTANDPLFIVDGVPFSSQTLSSPFLGNGVLGVPDNRTPGLGLSPFNSLNPSDIESIQVLKDAEATAIYGSRGANGVILITTKKGKAGKTMVDLNTYTGASKVTRHLQLLNTQQYLAMRREAFQNDGLPLPSIKNNPFDANYDINGGWDTTRYTDWQKVLVGNSARFTNAQLNISGGNSNTQFLIGGGYSLNGLLFPGDFQDRKITLHANISHQSENHRFSTTLNTNYSNENNNLPKINLAGYVNFAPDVPSLFDGKGNLNWELYNGSPTFRNNPLAYIFTSYLSDGNTLVANWGLSYLLLPGLYLKSNVGFTRSELKETQLTPSTSLFPPLNSDPSNRSNYYGNNDRQTWIAEPQISYQQACSKGVLDFLMGITFQDNIANNMAYRASGFSNDALIGNPAAATTLSLVGNQHTEYKYNALYGRLGYRWEDKYLLNLTGRRDGSSRFGPGRQFGNFGAIGAAWIFSKENFVQNLLPCLSFGKLRISYGTTGSDNLQDYYYYSIYTPSSTTYQGIGVVNPNRLTNSYFAWEMVKKWEGGLDLGLVHDKLNLSVSYYRNRTLNQLIGQPLPQITGFPTVQFNLPAIIQNSGIEVVLNTVNLRTKKLSWASSVNISFPRNKLVTFKNLANYPSYDPVYTVGQSIFSRKVYHYTGVDPQTGVYSFGAKSQQASSPQSPSDYVTTKPITQQYYGGLQNTLTYKGIQLDVLFQFVKQLVVLNSSGFIYPGSYGGQPSNQQIRVLHRWQHSGDKTDIQRFSQSFSPVGSAFSNFDLSDGAIKDASFIRLKNIAISYQLPQKYLKKATLQNVRFYIQCQNLLTVTKFEGWDPETGVGLNLPPLRTLTGGLQILF